LFIEISNHAFLLIYIVTQLENILVSDDANFSTVKIIDFGISSLCSEKLVKGCGTLVFMAPELIKK
jgi:serine/threonine protein kinase